MTAHEAKRRVTMFKKLAKIYALIAEMEAIKTEVIARQDLNNV